MPFSGGLASFDNQGVWALRCRLWLLRKHSRVDRPWKVGQFPGLTWLDGFEAGFGGELMKPRVGQNRQMLLPAKDKVLELASQASTSVWVVDEPVGVAFCEFADRGVPVRPADPKNTPWLQTTCSS